MARNFRSKRGYYLENPPKLGDISRNTIFGVAGFERTEVAAQRI